MVFKKIIFGITCAAIILNLAACSSGAPKEAVTANNGTIDTENESSNSSITSEEDTYDYLGIGIPKGQIWKEFSNNVNSGNNNGVFNNYQDKDEILYGYISDYFMSDEALAESQKQGEWDKQKIIDGSRLLYQIAVYKKGKAPNENMISEPDYLKNKQHTEKIGENDELEYFFYWDDFRGEGLSEASKDKYKQLYDDMMNFKNNIRIFTPDPKAVETKIQELKKIQEGAAIGEKEADEEEAASKNTLQNLSNIDFKTKDLNGNEISSDLFKDNKVTMINIWATFCQPCIKEMPDIAALAEELKDKGFDVIGIVADTVDENFTENKANIELAKTIVIQTGVKYTNLITNEGLSRILPVSAYPTTLFVNSKGNIIGEVLIGSKSKEEYKQIILSLLDNQ